MTITVVKGLTATQNESGATFDGGAITNSTINSSTIGATTPSTGSFTTVSATGTITTNSVFAAASGTATLPAYTFQGNVSAGMYLIAGNQVGMTTNGQLRQSWINTGQTFISNSNVGTIFALTTAGGALSQNGVNFQVNGSPGGGQAGHIGISNVSNDTTPCSIILAKSRGAAFGSYNVVVSGDPLGIINFNGADGTAMRLGAQILVQSDGSAGASNMPGQIQFKTTPNNSATPATALTIDSNQNVILTNGSAGLSFLTVASGQGAQAATLLNSPVAGNPSFYIPVRINGTIRFIPAW